MPFSRRPRKPAAPLDDEGLYTYAVSALARKMRTSAEMMRLLRSKALPGPAGETQIDTILARLREQRYLDDAAFASTYARLRQENEGLGKRRVAQDLHRKGLGDELISPALDTAYGKLEETEQARRYLARKRISKPKDLKETARVVRRLSAAGFSYASITKILRNWSIEVNEEDLAPSDSPPAE